jgi:hypothetical protein
MSDRIASHESFLNPILIANIDRATGGQPNICRCMRINAEFSLMRRGRSRLEWIRGIAAATFPMPQDAVDDAGIWNKRDDAHEAALNKVRRGCRRRRQTCASTGCDVRTAGRAEWKSPAFAESAHPLRAHPRSRGVLFASEPGLPARSCRA